MRDAWWIEELERLRQEQQKPVQIELELPLHEPYEEPPTETSPEPEQGSRGVVVIEF
jgi:hypothetical protein